MSDVEKKAAAARDIAAIEAVLNPPAPGPVPKAKPARVKPAPVAVPDDFDGGDSDDWDALPERGGDGADARPEPAPPPPVHAPIVPPNPSEIVYGPHGFPLWEKDADYIRATFAVARLEEQLREATAEAEKSSAVLGIKFNVHNPARVEAVAERLLAEGKPLDDVDLFESRCKLVRRLGGALELAKKAVHPAHEVAVKRLNAAAQEVLVPTYREMQLARVAFLKAMLKHRDVIARQRAAGFDFGSEGRGTVTTIPFYHDDIRQVIGPLVANGTLTPEDVAGLPGF